MRTLRCEIQTDLRKELAGQAVHASTKLPELARSSDLPERISRLSLGGAVDQAPELTAEEKRAIKEAEKTVQRRTKVGPLRPDDPVALAGPVSRMVGKLMFF